MNGPLPAALKFRENTGLYEGREVIFPVISFFIGQKSLGDLHTAPASSHGYGTISKVFYSCKPLCPTLVNFVLTTLSVSLLRSDMMKARVLELNASDERGIQVC